MGGINQPKSHQCGHLKTKLRVLNPLGLYFLVMCLVAAVCWEQRGLPWHTYPWGLSSVQCRFASCPPTQSPGDSNAFPWLRRHLRLFRRLSQERQTPPGMRACGMLSRWVPTGELMSSGTTVAFPFRPQVAVSLCCDLAWKPNVLLCSWIIWSIHLDTWKQ